MTDIENIKEAEINRGFDRNIDYEPMKDKLIAHFELLQKKFENLDKVDKMYERRRNIIIGNMIYTLISMIQLRCGSRISEACEAFVLFCKKGFDSKVTVKIAKSESTKFRIVNNKRKEVTTKKRDTEIWCFLIGLMLEILDLTSVIG